MYWQNMSTIASEIACFNDVFIKHNFDNHEGEVPIWAVVEVLSFGALSKIIKNLKTGAGSTYSILAANSDIEKEIEDYSCFTFPALRALEGYLKYLLAEKNIVIDEKHNFGTVFNQDASGKAIVIQKHVTNIADADYVEALEDVYNYFKANRHVIFHVDQILIVTKVIENKQEAISIINEVAALIEHTYKKAIK